MQQIRTVLQTYLRQLHMPSLRWTDIVEILIIAFLVYHIILWVRNTRAYSLLKGVLVVVVFVVLAALFNMTTILWIVQNVTGLAVTAMIVILQPELRSAMEELGQKDFLNSIFRMDNGEEVCFRITRWLSLCEHALQWQRSKREHSS